MLSFATIMLLAGIGIPIMAAMTSSLGKHLSSPVAASAFAFFIAFCIALLALMITDKSFVKQIPSAPKYLFVAGAFIAFYVLSIFLFSNYHYPYMVSHHVLMNKHVSVSYTHLTLPTTPYV